MKKGKTSKLQGFKTAKVIYGTVDSFELKSIYLNIQTWVEPKIEIENWSRVVLNLSRAIKHTIFNCKDNDMFDVNFLVDLDLRSSGIVMGKKSFLNLEINFFIKDKTTDFKSTELKEKLKEITKNIFKENFSNNKYFDFSLTKKDKIFDVEI
jgi:hypothetical protein